MKRGVDCKHASYTVFERCGHHDPHCDGVLELSHYPEGYARSQHALSIRRFWLSNMEEVAFYASFVLSTNCSIKVWFIGGEILSLASVITGSVFCGVLFVDEYGVDYDDPVKTLLESLFGVETACLLT
ncbi:hypothetical protein C0J52_14709 [Blattella germanica]|nr:hypothetical protein C0J52_14709 [Blattella germanica]